MPTPDDSDQTIIFDPDVLIYAAQVAKALEPLRALQTSYGEFFVSQVSFGFDVDDYTELAVVPNEHGGLGVEVRKS